VIRRRLLTAVLVTASLTGCGAQEKWVMPDLVGSDLQAAQDAVQQITGFRAVLVSHDRTGANRSQVFDREWVVCTQSVAAGSEIVPDVMVDFGVVEQGDGC
jgi:hypothetical protein